MLKISHTILLVDDDVDDRLIFTEIVHEINPSLHILSANDGAEALELLERNITKPDIIFLDINMPRVNGAECLCQLKRRPKFSSIPVVMYSTSTCEREINKMKKLGAQDFISKPYSWNDLKQVVSKVIYKLLYKSPALKAADYW